MIADVNAGITRAMKAKDPVTLGALRMLKTALTNKEIEKGHPLSDQESLQVVASVIKQRKDSIEQFANAGRTDLVDKETAELKVIEAFLPPALDPTEVERRVAEAVAESGAVSPKDMGKAMKAAMAKLAGTGVDGKLVNELVRKRLGG
jgi:uncharacterized protein YqeY